MPVQNFNPFDPNITSPANNQLTEEDYTQAPQYVEPGISPPAVVLIAFFTFALGIGVTWYFIGHTNSFFLFCIAIGILALILGTFRESWVRWNEDHINQLTKYQKQELQLLKERQRDRKEKRKELKDFLFTSHDFEPDAQNLLYGLIKAAKRKRILVTAQTLMDLFFRSIK